MSETIDRARRSLVRELAHAEAQVAKLRKALAAIQALDGRGTGQRARRIYKGKDKVCATPGCGTHFQAIRKDARYCVACRVARRDCRERTDKAREGAAIKAMRERKKGTTLMRNTPSAAKK
jgi:hypothetical protein